MATVGQIERKLGLAKTLAIAVLFLSVTVSSDAYKLPKGKQTRLGKYLTASEAAVLVHAERYKVLFLDIRTRSEVQFVGFTPEVDAVVPYLEMNQSGDWDEQTSRFRLDPNPQFSDTVNSLLSFKGLNKNDKVILMCRAGDRSARAADALADAGWTNVYSVVDGFEGDMSRDGRRTVNGWKNARLPWTYFLDKEKLFIPSAQVVRSR